MEGGIRGKERSEGSEGGREGSEGGREEEGERVNIKGGIGGRVNINLPSISYKPSVL